MAVLALLPHCGGNTSSLDREPLEQHGDPAAGANTFIAIADAQVDSSRPSTNLGAEEQLCVDRTPIEYRTFLRFQVKGLQGRVKRATLRLFVTNGSTDGPVVHRVDPQWKEDVVTFDQQPSLFGPALFTAGALRSGSWAELDVTRAVTGNGVVNLGLYSSGADGADFSSREDRDPALHPRIVVEMEPVPPTNPVPAPDWVLHRGGPGDEHVQVMATAENGLDFLVAGSFTGSGDFGGDVFQGERGLVVARYGADGAHRWSHAYALGAKVEATGLAVSASGEAWLVGAYQGAPDLGTGALPFIEESPTTSGFFLLKLSPEGEPLWSRGVRAEHPAPSSGITRTGLVRAQAVVIDSQGSVVVTGHFQGEMSLGRGRLYADPGNRTRDDHVPALFLAKFHADGANAWSLAFPGGDSGTRAEALATDGAGFIYVGGDTDSQVLGATGVRTPFLGKLSANGTPQWFRALNGARGSIRALAPFAQGDVAFVGDINGRFSFGGKDIDASEDVLLGTLHATAADGWVHVLGGRSAGQAHALGVSAEREFIVGGWTRDGRLDLGGGALGKASIPQGDVLHFVARYDARGAHLDSRALGITGPGNAALQVTSGGQARLCVPFNDALSPDGATYASRGAGDLLFLQLTPE
ncbi:DNRLRE domain-containing protein [Myxococcus sp. CA051A]|uniref:CBM96 family carbohydrate-binding protein n=1 Tax=Myxococcus sp. CA051A TaxID=2741739 RepID=UPI00157B41D7|nr:DNRLRE domain-containing protein [Myxococcus sp. CA051A]NTX60587.1 DNRLRE domain-containing protein [Myxococcus sp. CA051A]